MVIRNPKMGPHDLKTGGKAGAALGLLLPVALAVAMAAWAGHGTSGEVFSHKLHAEMGVECAACHSAAETSTSAADDLLPARERCNECHEEGAEELQAVSWGAKREKPTLTEMIVSELVFSHKAHLERGLGCKKCHLDDPQAAAAPHIPPMGRCMDCHEGRGGEQDCATCHSRTQILLPESHGYDWIHRHRDWARQEDASCRRCHSEDYCQDCHEGAALLPSESAPTEYVVPYSSQLAGRGMVVERVHDLTYRYTHALDASGKERECSSCHTYETFCAECHVPDEKVGDQPAAGRPTWHEGADWAALGGDGGRHAEMAEKDMELCAACHEVTITGTDPTCLRCHRDSNPGRGNDPETHDSGFLDGLGEGDWHDDDNAICFLCHRREKGPDRFCNYCHDSEDEEEED